MHKDGEAIARSLNLLGHLTELDSQSAEYRTEAEGSLSAEAVEPVERTAVPASSLQLDLHSQPEEQDQAEEEQLLAEFNAVYENIELDQLDEANWQALEHSLLKQISKLEVSDSDQSQRELAMEPIESSHSSYAVTMHIQKDQQFVTDLRPSIDSQAKKLIMNLTDEEVEAFLKDPQKEADYLASALGASSSFLEALGMKLIPSLSDNITSKHAHLSAQNAKQLLLRRFTDHLKDIVAIQRRTGNSFENIIGSKDLETYITDWIREIRKAVKSGATLLEVTEGSRSEFHLAILLIKVGNLLTDELKHLIHERIVQYLLPRINSNMSSSSADNEESIASFKQQMLNDSDLPKEIRTCSQVLRFVLPKLACVPESGGAGLSFKGSIDFELTSSDLQPNLKLKFKSFGKIMANFLKSESALHQESIAYSKSLTRNIIGLLENTPQEDEQAAFQLIHFLFKTYFRQLLNNLDRAGQTFNGTTLDEELIASYKMFDQALSASLEHDQPRILFILILNHLLPKLIYQELVHSALDNLEAQMPVKCEQYLKSLQKNISDLQTKLKEMESKLGQTQSSRKASSFWASSRQPESLELNIETIVRLEQLEKRLSEKLTRLSEVPVVRSKL